MSLKIFFPFEFVIILTFWHGSISPVIKSKIFLFSLWSLNCALSVRFIIAKINLCLFNTSFWCWHHRCLHVNVFPLRCRYAVIRHLWWILATSIWHFSVLDCRPFLTAFNRRRNRRFFRSRKLAFLIVNVLNNWSDLLLSPMSLFFKFLLSVSIFEWRLTWVV